MPNVHGTYADVTPDELEATYVLLSEALEAIDEGTSCAAADYIESAMSRLGIGAHS
jgi:hypothetical protein